MKKEGGFTLVELLVVISIIGLLSTIVIASLSQGRRAAIDARRMLDIKQIQTALELYYNTSGQYPAITDNDCSGTEGYTTASNNFMQSLVTAGYLPQYPVDAGRVNCNIQYSPANDNGTQRGYVIFVHYDSKTNTGCVANAPYWSCIKVNGGAAW